MNIYSKLLFSIFYDYFANHVYIFTNHVYDLINSTIKTKQTLKNACLILGDFKLKFYTTNNIIIQY